MGQTVLSESKTFSKGNCKLQLDVSDFNSGIYLLELDNGTKSATHKIIIK